MSDSLVYVARVINSYDESDVFVYDHEPSLKEVVQRAYESMGGAATVDFDWFADSVRIYITTAQFIRRVDGFSCLLYNTHMTTQTDNLKDVLLHEAKKVCFYDDEVGNTVEDYVGSNLDDAFEMGYRAGKIQFAREMCLLLGIEL